MGELITQFDKRVDIELSARELDETLEHNAQLAECYRALESYWIDLKQLTDAL